MKKDGITVIIPAHNASGTIRRAVESVLAQNVDLELLIVDDCSTDHPELVLADLLDRPEVTLVRNERNLGAAKSRNLGAEMAGGDWIAFLDADDWWEEGKLEKQQKLLRETGAVLCSTARELVLPDGTCTGRVIPVSPRISYRRLLTHNCINCSSVMIRTDVMREFPMDHEESHEDYICWLRVLRKYGFAVAVDEPLLKYRLTDKGKSGNKLKSARMTYTAYRCSGLSRPLAALCFAAYTCNGVRKYLMSYRKQHGNPLTSVQKGRPNL